MASIAVQNYKRLLAKNDTDSQSLWSSSKVHFFATSSDASVYEVFGEYAEDLCRALYRPMSTLKTHATINTNNDHNTIVSLPINEQALPMALKECLFVQSWAVAVVNHEGRVIREATPGNLAGVEDLLDNGDSIDNIASELPSQYSTSSSSTNCGDLAVVSAICFKDGKVSVVAVQGMAMTYCHFEDDPFLTTTETCLVQLAVKEVLLADRKTDADIRRVVSIAQALNCIITPLKPSCFDEDNGEADLLKMCRHEHQVSLIAKNCPQILGAVSALCGYMNLLSFDAAYHQYTVAEHRIGMFMRLDETALRSLDLFPKHTTATTTLNNGNGASNGRHRADSLFGLLNRCKTGQGGRLLGQWIRQPLTDLKLINQRLDIQEALHSNPLLCKSLQDLLKGCSDLQRTGRRLCSGRAKLQDLLILHQVIQRAKQLQSMFTDHHHRHHQSDGSILHDTFASPLSQILSQLTPYESMIESSVDMDAISRHEYCVKADFDAVLSGIAEEKEKVVTEMNREFQQLSIKCGLERFKKLKMERSNIYGHHFRVSRLDFNLIKQSQQQQRQAAMSIIEYAVLKSGVLFATVPLKELSDRYKQLEYEFMSKQGGIVKEMVKQAVTFKDLFDGLNSILAVIDVSVSICVATGTAVREYCRPQLLSPCDDSIVDICEGRHPVLEEVLTSTATGSNSRFVENDYKIIDKKSPRFHFITGPNMGGKSTFMRQVALIALMAQMGCYVPARRARLPVFDAVLVRVGAGDNLPRGLSTFQAEMQEMAHILRTCTPSSLVIIDELGRGTSTTEGFGLAWSISKHLACRHGPLCCLFATHFHELAALAVEMPDLFGNLRMRVSVPDPDTITGSGHVHFEYKVEEGASERSFGVYCAKMAAFPRAVRIEAASHLAGLEGRLVGLDAQWIEDAISVVQAAHPDQRGKVFESLLEQVDDCSRQAIMEILSS